MRFRDIQNQTTWVKQCEVEVLDVGSPEVAQFGWCQVIDVKDGQGVAGCLNVFLDDLMGVVLSGETGKQWYDIKWDRQKEYYKARPALAPPKIQEAPVHEPTAEDVKGRRDVKVDCIRSAVIFLPDSARVSDAGKVIEVADVFLNWIYKS